MIVPFQPEHATQIHLQRNQPLPEGYLGELEGWAKQVHSNGPSFTILDGDSILACYGAMITRKGIAEAWLVVSEEMSAGMRVRELIKSAREMIPFLMKDLGVHRLGAWVRMDFIQAIRLLEMLGFEREGIMRKYDVDGQNCYLYSIIRENHNGG